jgi:hypothetical protein
MRKSYALPVRVVAPSMQDSIPAPRAPAGRPSWARVLQRAAFLLAASFALFGSSLAIGRWIVSLPGLEFIYADVLLAWIGVVAAASAWPNLWAGLRDLRARQPDDANGVIAWRALLLTLLVAVATVVGLLLQYRAVASTDVWIFFVSWSVLRFAGWSIVPILALHGIIFGRVARSLEPRFRYLTDVGVLVLFAVAAATTVAVLQSPGATAFIQTWSFGYGVMPAAAALGYVLIAVGMSTYSATVKSRILTTRARPLGSSAERPFEVFR